MSAFTEARNCKSYTKVDFYAYYFVYRLVPDNHTTSTFCFKDDTLAIHKGMLLTEINAHTKRVNLFCKSHCF